ncbi:uncharacterized protein LOC115958117 [Quercus lobata]|uniref:uncharacterized protein LOC115958117 n=1 Tax=Quercus lobata TaxID=97700 RepID=UPI001248F403|nr:uncharacterized protein LOC115958117 [Quercus lobata]
MSSSSNGSSFLTFQGKKYDQTFDWNDEEGLLQDPKTHAPYSHMDIKSLKSRGSLQMLKSIWEALSPAIKNIINDAGFGTFFEALLNQETHEYKDLQLLLALLERFWDTTCTFHFPGIGEVMLTPYDFSIIRGLKLGGERIRVHDSLSSNEIKKLLGVMPSKMRSKNVHFSWLCENITKCDTVAKGTRMFMLLFIGTFLCPDLGSTMNLRYLWSIYGA